MICFTDKEAVFFVLVVASTFMFAVLCICVAKYRRVSGEETSLPGERSPLRSPLGVRPTQPPPLPPLTSRSAHRSFHYTLPSVN